MNFEYLKELYKKSSQVIRWYPVRGPFGLGFYVSGGEGYENRLGVAVDDDAKYAAAAMNEVPNLLARIEQLEKQLKAFKMSEDL